MMTRTLWLWLCLFSLGLWLIPLVSADTDGVWHQAEDVRPGVFGDDEVTNHSQPPYFEFRYLFVGMLYDRDDANYFVNPSDQSELAEANVEYLTVQDGNVVHQCSEFTSSDYTTLSCPSGTFANAVRYQGGSWRLSCCQVN